MTLRLLYMSGQIIQMMAFTQIMNIWKPWGSPWDHLKLYQFQAIYYIKLQIFQPASRKNTFLAVFLNIVKLLFLVVNVFWHSPNLL